MDIFAVRGATTVNSDCAEEVTKKTVELISELVQGNSIDSDNRRCVSVIVSTTTDIKSFFPARAVRESGLLNGVPLFSCTEPKITGSLPLCIRVMLTVSVKDDYAFNEKHVYLHKAAALRPDLAIK